MTGEAVRLSVPASLEYVRLVRLTASGIATRLGFDVDEIEDLRIAVDELASIVLEASGEGDFEILFLAQDDELLVEGSAPVASGAELRADPLSADILAAVVDRYEMRVDDGRARFTCVRRLPSGS